MDARPVSRWMDVSIVYHPLVCVSPHRLRGKTGKQLPRRTVSEGGKVSVIHE